METRGTAGSAGRRESARAAWVGRLNLWLVTLFLLASLMAVPAGLAWLMAPDMAAAVYRGATAAVLATGGALFVGLFILQRFLAPEREFHHNRIDGARVHVGLTAFNDEACIGEAVREFTGGRGVERVVVVDNNSIDRTSEEARAAGADAVVVEARPGYGACCMRALAEASTSLGDDDVVVLCEGDLTFSAEDLPKFLAFLENADLVLGTRTTQELRAVGTQLDWLMNPANQVVAKLIQVRFWGTRLTDVGCTYRAMRVAAYRRLAPRLRVEGNHFSPHLFIEALKLDMRVVEIPVVFRKRGGISKGVGSNYLRAAVVALRMLGLLYRA